MPPVGSGPQIDLSRPGCRRTYNRIQELQAWKRHWANRLPGATGEERENILHTIDGIEESIEGLEEQLHEQGCYRGPPLAPGTLLKITGVEVTQSTQYFSVEGTGAGSDNSIPLIAHKPLLVRVYLRSVFTDAVSVTGRISVMVFNRNTLKYDKFRRRVDPIQAVSMAGTTTFSASRRRDFDETLNFVIPAADCHGKVRLDALAWVEGHQGEAGYLADGWEQIEFQARRTPIIHCFRIRLSQTISGTSMPKEIAAPSDADCRTTMDHARRMLPVPGLDIRDRGERHFAGPLETVADYDAVRADIMTLRNGTTPTPQAHEIYVGMLPIHENASRTLVGNSLNGSIQSIVHEEEMFSHELGHLVLPGDDHVNDPACTLSSLLTQIDMNYPDYPNAIQRAGIGEWGVDLGESPPRLFSPEIPEFMSYCLGRKWISPYNYQRAFNGELLDPFARSRAGRSDAQKLLLSFRLYRDGKIEFKWALHLPGEPPQYPVKGATDIVLELYDAGGALLASAACHRSSDRLKNAPYEDLQEVLPWFGEAACVLVIQGNNELARWPIEDPVAERLVGELRVGERARSDGGSSVFLRWRPLRDAARLHYLLRYTSDDGRTWIPVTNALKGTEVEMDSMLLRGVDNCRFQLAVSTGFRTTFVESAETVAGRSLAREVKIVQPENGRRIARGDHVWLLGSTTTRFDGRVESVDAYWSSNRDGFLADGLHARVSGLSVGRHVVRLTIENGSGGEMTQSAVLWVDEQIEGPHELHRRETSDRD